MSLDNPQVLQQPGTQPGTVSDFLNVIEVEEVMKITVDYQPAGGGSGEYTASAIVPYKSGDKPQPAQILAFIDAPLSDVDEFVQPLPAFGTTGYDAFYGGYPGVGYVRIQATKQGVDLEAVSDNFFFDNPTNFTILVLKNKININLIK